MNSHISGSTTANVTQKMLISARVDRLPVATISSGVTSSTPKAKAAMKPAPASTTDTMSVASRMGERSIRSAHSHGMRAADSPEA